MGDLCNGTNPLALHTVFAGKPLTSTRREGPNSFRLCADKLFLEASAIKLVLKGCARRAVACLEVGAAGLVLRDVFVVGVLLFGRRGPGSFSGICFARAGMVLEICN